HDGIADIYRAVAYAVENALNDMRERNDVIKAEQTRRTLDGVRGAEDRIDRVRLRIEPGAFDREQRAFHVLQQLAAFNDEGLQWLIEIHEKNLPVRRMAPVLVFLPGLVRYSAR